MNTKEVTIVSNEQPQAALMPVYQVSQILAQMQAVTQLIKDAMVDNRHYGTIPGTGKPTLLKPGAEMLCMMFGLSAQFTVSEREFPNGHREFLVNCSLVDSHGRVRGMGLGSCSTMEKKYRWRSSEIKCPECGKETVIKGRAEYGGGWICFAKKGGCGAKYADQDPAIVDQPRGTVENPDIADIYNTCLKMGKKRSHIDATLTTLGASDFFTQDLEDLAEMLDKKVPAPELKVVNSAPMTITDKIKHAAKHQQSWMYDLSTCEDEGVKQDLLVLLLESEALKDSKGIFHTIESVHGCEGVCIRMGK